MDKKKIEDFFSKKFSRQALAHNLQQHPDLAWAGSAIVRMVTSHSPHHMKKQAQKKINKAKGGKEI